MIVDNDAQLVSVVRRGDAFEGGANGGFRFTRTGDLSQPLTVTYSVGGTAVPYPSQTPPSNDPLFSNYFALSGSVTFAAGAGVADVPVVPVSDDDIEANGTLVVTLLDGPDYQRDPNSADFINVVDDDAYPGQIGGTVWNDDGDGIREETEPVVTDARVILRDADGSQMYQTVTGADGRYLFRGLALGTYSVQVYPPLLQWFAPPDQTPDETIDSDVNPGTGQTDEINLTLKTPFSLFVNAGFVMAAAPPKPTKSEDRIIITGPDSTTLAANGLRVAKWNDAFEEDPTSPVNNRTARVKGPSTYAGVNGDVFDFIDRDDDRFNVRVYDWDKWAAHDADGTPTWKTLSATIATSNGPNSPYNDAATTIPLNRINVAADSEWAGWYWSDSQILVSNTVDDTFNDPRYLAVDEAAPDATKKNGKGFAISDRTHKIALGGTLIAKYGDLPERKVAVKVDKVARLHVTILKDKVNGTQVIDPEKVNKDIALMREMYAQVGIGVVVVENGANNSVNTINEVGTEQVKDPPANVKLADGLRENDGSRGGGNQLILTTEEKALLGFAAYRTPTINPNTATAIDDIEVYYVNLLEYQDPSTGLLTYKSGGASYPAEAVAAEWRNSVIISAKERNFRTLAHECFHVLLNDGKHEGGDGQSAPPIVQRRNLLATLNWSLVTGGDVKDSRRLTTAQESKLKSPDSAVKALLANP